MHETAKKQVNKQNLTLVKDCREKFTQEEKFFIKELIISELSEIISNIDYDDDDSMEQCVNSLYYKHLLRKRNALNKLYQIFDI